jgi:hypothetical protein
MNTMRVPQVEVPGVESGHTLIGSQFVSTFRGIGFVDGSDELRAVSAKSFIATHLPFFEEGRNIVALFVLERDEDGDFLFTDTVGAMLGCGVTFKDAFEDWYESAIELSAEFREHRGTMNAHVACRAELLTDVLGDS